MKRRNRALALGLVSGASVVGLSFLVGRDWGPGAAIVSVVYAVLVTIFLVAQIVGFIASQVTYSESVEATKFQVLEAEGIECRGR